MGGVGLGGGQGGCERRIEVFVKIHKKKTFFFWGGGSGRGRGSVGGVGLGGGVSVDVNEELKFFVKIQKKIIFFFWGGGPVGGGGSVAEGVRCGGGSGWWGVRVDVNAMYGVGGDVGYRGCEPRKEGIVQCIKRYCTILRK